MMTLLAFQSSVRPEYDWFFWVMVVICTTVATSIAGFLLYSAWHYRRRDPDELPGQLKSNVVAESLWIGIPLLLFLGMFFYGTKLYFDMERAPDNAETIYVVGKQWMWKLQHLDGTREINELHVPVGKSIELTMISQDVIHSFYVPAFRIKQDVLPSRYTSIWFRATLPGTYHLFCAEYCGTNHSQMNGWIYAMNPKDYNSWLEHGGAEGSLADTGEKLFHQFACSNCHHYAGHGDGPNLVGLYGTETEISGGGSAVVDDTYIRNSILNPNLQVAEGFQSGLMPVYQGQLKEEDVIALIAYIKALGSRPAPAITGPSAQGGEPGSASDTPTPEPVGNHGQNGDH